MADKQDLDHSLQLLLVEDRKAQGKQDHARGRCYDQRGQVLVGGFQSIDQGISTGQEGGQILTDLGESRNQVGRQCNGARTDENPRVGGRQGGKEHHEGNDPQAEHPPEYHRG